MEKKIGPLFFGDYGHLNPLPHWGYNVQYAGAGSENLCRLIQLGACGGGPYHFNIVVIVIVSLIGISYLEFWSGFIHLRITFDQTHTNSLLI